MPAFFDTNILIYAFSDDKRAGTAKSLLDAGGCISVQCLNEFASVSSKKLAWTWIEIGNAVHKIVALCGEPVALDFEMHCVGRRIAERYRLSVYDGMIVAAALGTGCDTLYSEDMHDGLVIDGHLRIVNPFVAC